VYPTFSTSYTYTVNTAATYITFSSFSYNYNNYLTTYTFTYSITCNGGTCPSCITLDVANMWIQVHCTTNTLNVGTYTVSLIGIDDIS
jgi:hypothetical protein